MLYYTTLLCYNGGMNESLNYYPGTNTSGKTFDEWVAVLHLQQGGNLYFVEVGAMDGVNHDPMYRHIMANPSWSGLLVEPLPDMFAKLKANYAKRKNLAFENVAITETDGTAEIARIPAEKVGSEAPAWADGISTLKPSQHILGQNPALSRHMVTEAITTMTMASLLKKHGITHIDLYASDTEGYDKVIFEQLWQTGLRPHIIKLEINYMLYHHIRDIHYQLASDGYTCFYEGDDMVAVKL